MTDSSQKLCLVTGVGDGTGTALVRRFAAGGYRVAMLARNRDRLAALERDIAGSRAFPCDLRDLAGLGGTLDQVAAEMGAPSVAIHNAPSALGLTKRFADISVDDLEQNFKVNVSALLVLAQKLAPAMTAAEDGAILVTGNTGSWRGSAGYASFAPTKAAQRILAESMARDLGPKGVHVAYIVIDAIIDMPFMRTHWHPDKPDSFFAKPQDIADEFFRIAHQPRSTWSFNVELRPFGEKW